MKQTGRLAAYCGALVLALAAICAGRQKVQAITRLKDGTLEKEPFVMPVYDEGYLGLRSLHAWVSFDNLKVFALKTSP